MPDNKQETAPLYTVCVESTSGGNCRTWQDLSIQEVQSRLTQVLSKHPGWSRNKLGTRAGWKRDKVVTIASLPLSCSGDLDPESGISISNMKQTQNIPGTRFYFEELRVDQEDVGTMRVGEKDYDGLLARLSNRSSASQNAHESGPIRWMRVTSSNAELHSGEAIARSGKGLPLRKSHFAELIKIYGDRFYFQGKARAVFDVPDEEEVDIEGFMRDHTDRSPVWGNVEGTISEKGQDTLEETSWPSLDKSAASIIPAEDGSSRQLVNGLAFAEKKDSTPIIVDGAQEHLLMDASIDGTQDGVSESKRKMLDYLREQDQQPTWSPTWDQSASPTSTQVDSNTERNQSQGPYTSDYESHDAHNSDIRGARDPLVADHIGQDLFDTLDQDMHYYFPNQGSSLEPEWPQPQSCDHPISISNDWPPMTRANSQITLSNLSVTVSSAGVHHWLGYHPISPEEFDWCLAGYRSVDYTVRAARDIQRSNRSMYR